MMKIAATIMYVLLFLLSGYLMIISMIAIIHLPWSWRPDYIAYTFIPMVVFSGFLLFLQTRETAVVWLFVVQCVIVGVLLLYTFANHMYPERSSVLASLHLISVVSFIAWDIYRLVHEFRGP